MNPFWRNPERVFSFMQRRTLFSDALDTFYLDCEIKRLKPKTIKFYQVTLQNLVTYCNERDINYLSDITSKILKDFSKSLIGRNLSTQYQHNILRATRAFFNFCVSDELIGEAPKIVFPKLPKEVKKALTKEEIKSVLSACRSDRDRLIILLFLDTGLRNNELCSLDASDIDIKEGLILVRHGKTGQRYVPIGANVRKKLLIHKRNKTILFFGKTGKRITISGIVQMFKRLRKRTGIAHLSAHSLRRTFAISCIRNGMNIHILAKMMGHTTIDVLKHYLDISTEDLQKAQKQFGVVDNL